MPSLYAIQQEITSILQEEGYTVYEFSNFDNRKITQLKNEYPVVCIGRGTEVTNNEGSPTDFIIQDGEISMNVVLETTKENLDSDSATELRKIKDIVYGNRTRQNFWCDWIITENFTASLQSVNDFSNVYGGLDITTTVNYREKQIEGVL